MLHDPEFHAGQAYFGLPRGINHEFDRFCLYNGGVEDHEPVLVGRLPAHICNQLDWPTDEIYASRELAQKARFKHGLSLSLFQAGLVAEFGNIFTELARGNGQTVVFTLPLFPDQPRWFYMPCKLDSQGRGIFIKTLWLQKIRKTQWRKLKLLYSRVTF